MKTWQGLLLLALFGFALGCDGATTATKPAPDASTDAVASTDASDPGDTTTVDLAFLDLPDLADVLECPGASGCGCASDGDCNTGLCVETASGRQCAALCTTDCPAGFVCRSYSQGGDPVSYCAPVGVRQCAPCQTNGDCNAPYSAPAECVNAGTAGRFCASVCQVSADCTGGLACTAVAGSTTKVCQPAEGLAACSCSDWATKAGAQTSCEVQEGTKLCPGSRQCTAAGLSACDKLAGEPCVDAGCKGAKNGSPCDDNDPCTQSECQSGVCSVTDNKLCECQASTDCPDDGNLCNGKTFCDKSAVPYVCKINPASVVKCQATANDCQQAVCLPATGTCTLADKTDTAACEDGKACTVGDYCVSGSCVSGTVTCSCSADSDCDPYEDGNFCNGKLFCNKAKGQCQVNPASVVVCPTGLDSTCRTTVCQPTTGQCLQQEAPASQLCDDGNPCSASDHCEAGQCISSVAVCPCASDADCVSQEDGDLCNGTLYCELGNKTCQVNPKTVISCAASSDPCQNLSCDAATGLCTAKAVSGSCEDGNPCTAPGSCAAGKCQPGPNLCQCLNTADCAVFDDGNPCNGTFYCDSADGQCKTNLSGIPACPPTASTCQVNSCDPASGACKVTTANDGTQCSDDEPCTKNDRCEAGQCIAGLSVCACIADADCADEDDGDPCNGFWFCNKTDGPPACAFSATSASSCADAVDGDADTEVNSPPGPQCADGIVDPGEECDDAGKNNNDGCSADCHCEVGFDGAPCSDGNACTVGDTCQAGSCVNLKGPCNDDKPGTLGTCKLPEQYCQYEWIEICNSQDEDQDSLINDVYCNALPCTCDLGVAVCDASCTACPDPGDQAITIDIQGSPKVVCAHNYPAWGLVPLSPDTLQDSGNDTILDTRTGLEWQKTPPGSLMDWTNAQGYCDSLLLADQPDWRLPTIAELRSLVDYTDSTSPVLSDVFGPMYKDYFWTVTPSKQSQNDAWYVQMQHGFGYTTAVGTGWGTRCVRSAEAPSQNRATMSRWLVSPDGLAVMDATTELTWQREASTATATTNKFSWEGAKTYCADLVLGNRTDWRLPEVTELLTLVDPAYGNPAAMTPSPLSTKNVNVNHWTNTAMASLTTPGAWFVDFEIGSSDSTDLVLTEGAVRCVHGPICGDGLCQTGEAATCGLDCGCDLAQDVTCVDYNACTEGDVCSGGSCLGTQVTCDDNDPCTNDSCDGETGCVFVDNGTCPP